MKESDMLDVAKMITYRSHKKTLREHIKVMELRRHAHIFDQRFIFLMYISSFTSQYWKDVRFRTLVTDSKYPTRNSLSP